MKLFKPLLITLLAYGGAMPAAHAISPDSEFVRELEKKHTAVLPETASGDLLGVIRAIFKDLSEAQLRLINSKALIVNDFYIVDDLTDQAYVAMHALPGVAKQHNRVVISTGMLLHLFDLESLVPDASPAEIERAIEMGLRRLVGVLCHELAHPRDVMDERGLLNTHGSGSSQGLEVRAHLDGSEIAIEAGYPFDVIHDALAHTHAVKRRTTERRILPMVLAMLKSHPHPDLALSTKRLYLSLRTLLRGDAAVTKHLGDTRGDLIGDLRRYQRRPSRDLAEVLRRANELKREMSAVNLEANILLLEFDLFTADNPPGLVLGEACAALLKMIRLLHPYAGDVWTDTLTVRENLGQRDPQLLARLGGRTHADFVDSALFYGDPLVQAEIKDQMDNTTSAERFSYISDLPKLFRPGDLERLWEESIRTAVRWELRRGTTGVVSSDGTHRPSLIGGDVPTFIQVIAPIGWTLARRGEASTYDAYVKDSTGLEYLLPLKGLETKARHSLTWSQVIADPRNQTRIRALRAVWTEIWEQRGRYATADLLRGQLRRQTIDWAALMSVLGIPETDGWRALTSAIGDYLVSPQLDEDLAKLRDERPADLLRHKLYERRRERLLKVEFDPRDFKANRVPLTDIDIAARTTWRALELGPIVEDLVFGNTTSATLAERVELFKAYLALHESVLKSTYADGLRSLISDVTSLEDYVQKEANLYLSLFTEGSRARTERLEIRIIDRSKLRIPLKRELIAKLIENPHLIANERSKYRIKYDIHPDEFELIRASAEAQAKRDHRRGYYGSGPTKHYVVVKDHLASALREVERASTPETLLEIARIIYAPAEVQDESPPLGTLKEKSLTEAVIASADRFLLSDEQKVDLFWMITRPGHGDETDRYFRRAILPNLSAILVRSPASAERIDRSLKDRRFGSFLLEIEVARLAVAAEADALANLPAPRPSRQISGLLDRLQSLAARNSTQKDEYLEDLAWRLDIEDERLLAYLESLKSFNWRRTHPTIVNLGTGLAELSEGLSHADRLEMINFLMIPRPTAFPIFLKRLAEKKRRDLAPPRADSEHDGYVDADPISDSTSDRATRLLTSLGELRPFERIPAFEFLLGSGERNVMNDEKMSRRVMRRFLGYEPNSKKERYLAAYLRLRPAFMRPATLAYLLAAKMDPSPRSENAIYEVFGSMGIAGAQTGAILGYLTGNAADLKDNAIPLTKAQVVKLLKERLTPEERGRIKRIVGVLGSASINTAVEVELPDGSRAVALVQRPYARDLIRTNAKFLREFAAELARVDGDFPLEVAREIIDVTESQLIDELDTAATARKIQTAVKAYERHNVEMRGQLDGWNFYVPRLIEGFTSRDGVLMIEKIEGETFDRLGDPSARAHVGPLIVRSSLRNFFQLGWFNEDQHVRNVKIDVAHRRLNVFDFGKSSYHAVTGPLGADDRYLFANVLRAAHRRDANAVVGFALRLSDALVGFSDDARARLRAEVTTLLNQSTDLQYVLLALKRAFATEAVTFPKRAQLGTLKGLIILFNEGYVDPARFAATLGEEITPVLRRKALRLGYETCQDRLAGRRKAD